MTETTDCKLRKGVEQMGSGRVETRNNGCGWHEWDYIPLSDEHIVAELIACHGMYDKAQVPESVLTTYLDLELLISECGLSPVQRRVVDLLMSGYNKADVAETLCMPPPTVNTLLKRAVQKIVHCNNQRWQSVKPPCD